MKSEIMRMVGKGDQTYFLEDWWVGEGLLKAKFPIIFRLSVQKGLHINELGTWVDGIWIWDLRWRWRLREREEESLSELIGCLNKVQSCRRRRRLVEMDPL